jgi:MoaA/NifB/PqqE/SkfB family radical SAM enzyme
VLVRRPSPYGHGRASYELNLGCNYDCEHCYLGLKQFEGLSWPDRERLLHLLCEAGVLWLQLTGDEPLIDKLFIDGYSLASELSMMISISSNGSRLSNPKILELLTSRRPYRLTLSVYGASAASYDGLTRRRGSFAKFARGLAAAHEASLPINLNLIVARQNAHQLDQMRAMGVLPEHRGHGHGRALWQAATAWAAQHQAAYQLLQAETGQVSEGLFLSEGLTCLGFTCALAA